MILFILLSEAGEDETLEFELSVPRGVVRRSADEYETAIAIAAIGIALLVDLDEDTRMAERGAAGNLAGAVTGDARVMDAGDFGRCDHGGER